MKRIFNLLLGVVLLINCIIIQSPAFAETSSAFEVNQTFRPVADGFWDTYQNLVWRGTNTDLYTSHNNTEYTARQTFLKFDLSQIRTNLAKGCEISKATVKLTVKGMNQNFNFYQTNPTNPGPKIALYAFKDDEWTEDETKMPTPLTQTAAENAIVSKDPSNPEINYVEVANQATNVTVTLDIKDHLLSVLTDENDSYVSFEVGYRSEWMKDGTYMFYSKEYTENISYQPQLCLTYCDSDQNALMPNSSFEKKQEFEADADIFYEKGSFCDPTSIKISTEMVNSGSAVSRTAFLKFPLSGVRANIAEGASIKSAKVKLYLSTQYYADVNAKVSLFAYDNDAWTEDDTSSLSIRQRTELVAISNDPRNMSNNYVELRPGLTTGTPILFDITDAVISEVSKQGDNYISMEVGYFSEWIKSGITTFYSRNYTGGFHPMLEVEYAEIKISDACIFQNDSPVAVPKSGANVLEYTISNSYLSEKTVNPVWGIYSVSGNDGYKLVDVYSEAVTVNGSSQKVVSREITLPETKNGVTYVAKLMFLRDMETLVPLTERRDFIGDDLWMPSIFASNAVLQRDMELPIWGKASVGAAVKVKLDGNEYNTTADRYGEWQVIAEPISLSDTPYTLTVESGDDKLEFNNLLAGDVWFCSGQSNMEFELQKTSTATDDLAEAANYSNIRLFSQEKWGTDKKSDDVKNGTWSVCDARTVAEFSAVGYLFGKEIYDELNVPIGLIDSAYGGAPMEAYVSYDALDESNLWFHTELRNSDTNLYACRLFNAMVEPIIPYSIKGVLWYQGEENGKRYNEYLELQGVMLENWREQWGYDFPFVYTQIAPYSPKNLPEIREAQRLFLKESENTAMAVIMDCGQADDIHPTNKRPVAERLALCAKHLAYNIDGVEWKFPEPVSFSIDEEGAVTITYDGVYNGLKTSDNSVVTGFELCGIDSDGAEITYTSATSVLINDDNTITVKCDNIVSPTGIRYGYYAYPMPELNLYNSAGLIATPFIHSLSTAVLD